METKQNYVYPIGDFISGFSDDKKNPCKYEIECQRMVIRGLQYLDKNPLLFDQIKEMKLGTNDKLLAPMVNFMCSDDDNLENNFGQTGAMVNHTVTHAYYAKKMGWDKYIEKLLS